MTRGKFAEAVAAYCGLTGGSVTSGGRSQNRNALMAGQAMSGHRFFVGADVVYDADLTPAETEQIAAKLGRLVIIPAKPPLAQRLDMAQRLGLLLLAEGDHDHLQPLDWKAG